MTAPLFAVPGPEPGPSDDAKRARLGTKPDGPAGTTLGATIWVVKRPHGFRVWAVR